jgi:bifunctional non-homologous end joining protein LigD
MPRKKPQPKKRASALEAYQRKRDFAATPEPKARKARTAGRSFVVQEHHARSHHFDFRLEMNGVLVSWAVPKGPPEDFAAKRLAVHVEDHPLEYGKFEGEIPKGNYGAGKVAIWDKGEWEPVERDWRKEFEDGKLKFALRGGKLKGTYLLARMKEEPNWLFRKLEDERPVAEVTRETPAYVPPQLARVVPSVPEGREWIHEIKLDGYRLIVVRHGSKLQLFTRSGLDWTDRFSDLAQELGKLSKKDFILDGEAVVFDAKGRSNFGGLQSALQDGKGGAIHFVAFDLLHEAGENLRALPLSDRLARLQKLVPNETGRIRRSKVWAAEEGKELFLQACKAALEGIISKKLAEPYREGNRNDWAKSKCRARQEFIICGYTPPKHAGESFGALVLASSERGHLVPRGKVGTGFSEAKRRQLFKTFQALRTETRPDGFEGKDVTWVRPELVAEIEFAEITRDGSIRQGSFVALREDKAANEVHLDPVRTAKTDAKDVKVAGITVSNPNRMTYPADQITKLEVVNYFESVGELMLPFVANRPLAMLRAPSGITGELFFQKSFTRHVPKHVKSVTLADGTEVIVIRTVKGLVSLAQFNAIELHPWGAPMPQGEKPDVLIWDLDPDEAVPWNEVLGGAFLVRDFLRERGLETVVKTSGGKGIHVMLYLKRTLEWEVAKAFAKAVAAGVMELNPQRFVITASKAKRSGKIFLDWLRNGRGATCIAPWGLRARPGAAVSRPVDWDQLPQVAADGFTLRDPAKVPGDWRNLARQTVSKALLKDLGVL